MKATRLYRLAALAIALFPSAAFASTEVVGIESLLFKAINFVLYVLLIVFLYKKYGAPALKERHLTVKDAIEASTIALAQAEKIYLSVERRYRNLEQEKTELAETFHKDAEKVSELIIQTAKKQAISIKQDSKHRVEQELVSAEKDVRKEVIEKATQLARAALAKDLSAEQDKQLRRDAVRGLFV